MAVTDGDLTRGGSDRKPMTLPERVAWEGPQSVRGRRGVGEYLPTLVEALSSPSPLDPNEWPPSVEEARIWLAEHPDGALDFLKSVVAFMFRRETSAEHTTAPAIDQVFTVAARSLMQGRLDREPVVLDISCGTGLLLASVAEAAGAESGRHSLAVGSDINELAVASARQVMRLCDQPSKILHSDVLQEDVFPECAVDIAVSDLPLGLRRPAHQAVGDPRFRFGVPGGDATLLFVQAMLSKLRSPAEGGGLALALVAGGALARGVREEAIRGLLTEADLLRAVISLPERLMDNTGVSVNLLVFDNAKPPGWRGKVQFVDLRSQFIDSKEYRGRRWINQAGLDELRRALLRAKPSRLARTLSTSELWLQDARVLFTPAGGGKPKAFKLPLQVAEGAADRLASKYLDSPHVAVESTGPRYVVWAPDRLFPPVLRSAPHGQQRPSWGSPPLVAMIEDVAVMPSISSKQREEHLPERDLEGCVAVPTAPTKDCVVLGPADEPPPEQVLLLSVRQPLDRRFLAHWLNSAAGREARRAAMMNHRVINAIRNETDALAFLNRMAVPLPPASLQGAITGTLNAIQAARSGLVDLEQETWSEPESCEEIRQVARSFVEQREAVEPWIETLPFPVAASLWTYVSRSHRPRDAYEQLLKAFEAFTEFYSTHLIAALRSDSSLWDDSLPRLRAKLQSQRLSFRRATFGTWRLTSEFLAGVIRSGINDDDNEESARFLALLGDPPKYRVTRLLSPDVARVVNSVIQLRNDWQGHGGTVHDQEADRRHTILRGHLLEMRAALGNGWAGLRLIRAGGSRWDGEKHRYDVEVLQGSRTPFAPDTLLTDRPLIHKGLYLVSESGGLVHLPPFVSVGHAPDSIEDTCYFYNKLAEEGSVRVVAYQHADEPDSLREDAGLIELVTELDGP